MYFWYKFLTYLFLPFSNIYLLFRKLKKKEHDTRYREKLSLINTPRNDGFLVWCHVASVGEAMSILPLIENFEKEKKIDKILITSITLSSGKILEKKYKNNKKIIHQFLPLDIPKFTNKFLNHWSPNLSIFIESEVWPNLIYDIKKKNIPLLLVNGRITKKTFSRWQIFKKFAKDIFGKFDLCIASNAETENFLKNLGAKNIKNLGNLKFAKTELKSNNKLNPEISEKIKSRKIWVAASTHSSEEKICAETHLQIKKTFNNVLTIIIPRHIDRVKKITEELVKLNLKIATYSNSDKLNDETDIFLIDVYGETLKFYNIAKCIFLGKSLVKSLIANSGQNPIEASRFGCTVYHGPNVNNFAEIYEYLKSLNVTKKINGVLELSQAVTEELKSDKAYNYQTLKKIN